MLAFLTPPLYKIKVPPSSTVFPNFRICYSKVNNHSLFFMLLNIKLYSKNFGFLNGLYFEFSCSVVSNSLRPFLRI